MRCLVISLKPDVSWVPAQCHALGIFTDCRLLRTCHCESAGRIYRKSAFLSACTPSCQQIGANPNRLRLPRDCRTACKSALWLNGRQKHCKHCMHLFVRHCCQLPCFLSLLPLLRHFCTHCNYILSIAAVELPHLSEGCGGRYFHLTHSHATHCMQFLVHHQHSESVPQVSVGSTDDPKDKKCNCLLDFCAAARCRKWERLDPSSCQHASQLISHLLAYLEQEHESL